jgi:hypothetical protein
MLVLNRPVDYDNRGDKDEPFGFVYFDDGTRLVYALGKLHSETAPIELRELAVEYLASQDITVTLL